MAAVCASGVLAAGRPFSLYQSIIDRQPFGEGPDDPSVPPENAPRSGRDGDGSSGAEIAKEQQELERAVSLSALNIAPDGRIMAGFSDMSNPQTPRHYYIAKGQTKDGWFLKDADPLKKTAVLVKDGIEIERTLGSGSAGGGASAAGAAAVRRGPNSRFAAARNDDDAGDQPSAMMSHRARKRERDEAERRERQARIEAERQRQEEDEARREAEKAEREAEREATRQNLQNMAEELRRMREENRRRREESEAADDSQTP